MIYYVIAAQMMQIMLQILTMTLIMVQVWVNPKRVDSNDQRYLRCLNLQFNNIKHSGNNLWIWCQSIICERGDPFQGLKGEFFFVFFSSQKLSVKKVLAFRQQLVNLMPKYNMRKGRPISRPKRWDISVFLGIHWHPKQKDFFKSYVAFLRAGITGHGHSSSFWKMARMALFNPCM